MTRRRKGMNELEKRVALEIINNNCIASSTVREMLGTNSRIVLTKGNFPNIRGLLNSHMTTFRRGPYRGGMAWVCVIAAKDIGLLKSVFSQPVPEQGEKPT
jgi:hypothetical protein